MQQSSLPLGSKLIDIPLASDARGMLCFATAMKEIPFPIERVFWIYDVPEYKCRGGHSHRVCSEVVVAVCGGFRMILDDGQQRYSIQMNTPSRGILVPAGIWCELEDFQPGTVVVVMASHPYDATGYCNDYETYLFLKNSVK